MNLFDKINSAIEGTEGSIITLVTTLIPWMAPALPAYLTWSHLVADMQIPDAVAVAMAATVEFLGLAAVSTAFSYMRHNQITRAAKNKVSLGFPVAAYVFYLIVVVTVNVVQEIPMSAEARTVAHVVSIALLTLISAPAFIIAVARDQQRKIEAEISAPKAEEKRNVPATDGKPKVTGIDWRDVPGEDRVLIAAMNTRQIQAMYGVSDRTARNWRAWARAEQTNGHRVRVAAHQQDGDMGVADHA